MRTLPVLLVLGLLSAGCGGGEASPTIAPTTTSIVTVDPEENTARPTPTPSGKPAFTITLTGESHQATVGRRWRYTVKAVRRNGRPAGGTAKMRVFIGRQEVDTLGFFAFEGTLSRRHTWPSVLRGKENVVLQAEVEGEGGTQRANWRVTVN